MNVKINKYSMVLLFLILFFAFLNFYVGNSKHTNDIYINKISNIFRNFTVIEEILDRELDSYFENNSISKYSVKEIRDKFVSMKFDIQNIINEIDSSSYYGNINKKYLLDILYDALNVVNNKFLLDDIFTSSDETIIKNFKYIFNDFKKVFDKYIVFKINLGIID